MHPKRYHAHKHLPDEQHDEEGPAFRDNRTRDDRAGGGRVGQEFSYTHPRGPIVEVRENPMQDLSDACRPHACGDELSTNAPHKWQAACFCVLGSENKSFLRITSVYAYTSSLHIVGARLWHTDHRCVHIHIPEPELAISNCPSMMYISIDLDIDL